MALLKKEGYRLAEILSFTLIIVVISHTLVHVAGSLRSSLYPLIKQEFTLTNTQVGIIAAAPRLFQALFTLPVGYLSDRFTSKKMITVSILLAATGALLAGFTQNVLMFIAAISLLALSSTFYHPPANSYITKTTPPDERPKVLGILNSGGISGFALGSFSITILMGFLGFQWRQLYQFWILPILFALIGLYFTSAKPSKIKSNTEEPANNSRKNKKNRYGENENKLLSTSMIFFLLSRGNRRFARGMVTAFLSIYLVNIRGWTVGFVGLLFGAGRLIGIGAASLGGALTSRFGEKKWAVITQFTSYTFFLIAFLVKRLIPFFTLYLVYRFIGMLGMPATSAITARLSPREKRGRGYALTFLPGSIVRTIGPLVAAFIADTLGIFSIFMISAIILYLGVGTLHFGVKIK